MKKYIDILSNFNIKEEITDIKLFGDGHINDTFLVICPEHKYVLQRINHKIFKNPEQVMENIANVCRHLKKKVKEANGNPEREVINLVKANDGKYFTEYDENFYRMYHFVDDASSYQQIKDPTQFYSAGKAFGNFQKMLCDFPADTLYETIEKFHDTKDRYDKFEQAVINNFSGRKELVKDEIEFVRQRKNDVDKIVKLLENKEIPLRVTHNDTKLNNVLIDSKSGEAVCVIDLDTIMPSTLLYDFGDAIRFGASTAEEDEKDLSKVWVDLNLFEVFAKGFIEELKDDITPLETAYLPFSAKIMTLECGIRFLTDYLDGDVYFKIHRDGHNLDRARTQFKLVEDMENKMKDMSDIIKKICDNIKN